MDFQVFSPNTRITARNRDRCRFQAWGILGGKAGRGSSMSLNPGRPDMRVLNNIDTFAANPGDIVSITSPGGGGRGDPLEREPERVLRDVVCNYVAIADAEADYGVVLTGAGIDLAVDLPATEALRASRQRNEPHPHFHFGAAREAYERVWTRQAYDAMTALLASLPVHWRFFVKRRLMERLEREGSGAAEVSAVWNGLLDELPYIRPQRAAAE
jgi:N-methylhydantoinase B